LKLSANHIIKILIFFLIFLPLSFAQQDTSKKKIYNISDTSAFAKQDTLQNKEDISPDTVVFVMSKSPMGAVLRSALLPGLGQIYTESYWKAPVIWGIAAWLISNWHSNNQQYKQNLTYSGLYGLSSDAGKGYLRLAKFYQDQRDLFAIYMGLTYILNLVDAYIDAQLFDFSVSRDPGTNSPMLNMRVKL
jgi:hypothetical protein